MFRKSFNPAKCKVKLKLAESRIKLLKNKNEADLKRKRKEVAQLLSSGKDKTAMIQVEHVVREDKMIGAYELIAMYCELIVQHLPTIQAQRNCPIDLKEAVTGIIFAAPRCRAYIPELIDVVDKQFIVKYGKEFVRAASELLPQCGVNRTLVEKLSVVAPDGPTKVKILTGIAEENNFKWEPTWFNEKDLKPPSPLEASNSGNSNRTQMNPPNFQHASNWEASRQGISSTILQGSTATAPNLRPFHSFEQPRREVYKISGNHRNSSSSTTFGPSLEPLYDDRSSSTDARPVSKHEFRDATDERCEEEPRAAAFLSGNDNPINLPQHTKARGFKDKGSSNVGSGVYRTGAAVSLLRESVSCSQIELTMGTKSSADRQSLLHGKSSSPSSYSDWEKAELLLRWAEELPEEDNLVHSTETSEDREGRLVKEDSVRRIGGHLHPNMPEDFETLVHRVKSLRKDRA